MSVMIDKDPYTEYKQNHGCVFIFMLAHDKSSIFFSSKFIQMGIRGIDTFQ